MLYILRFLLLFIFLSLIQWSYASTGSEIHESIERIKIDAYHGQYIEADKQFGVLIQKYEINVLAEKLSYDDVLVFLEGVGFYSPSLERKRQYYAFLDKRKELFPLQVTRPGFSFFDLWPRFLLKCQDTSVILADKTYYYYCLFMNEDISHTVKSAAWKDIEKLARRYTFSRNMLDLSNIGYMYQQYLLAFPEKKEEVRPLLNRIGKRMVKLDPHWTNAYIILSSSYESGSLEYKKVLSDASENYIGDSDRKDKIMNAIAEQ